MISVCIPWLPDAGPRNRIFEWIRARYELLLPDAELVVATGELPFNRSRARNEAVRQSSGDVLLIADADTTFPNVEVIRTAVDLVISGRAPWVIPYAEGRYYNMNEHFSGAMMRSHSAGNSLGEPPPGTWEHKITSWAGLLVMTRDAFEAVGGYDERFEKWSYEDNAFQIAMDTIVGPHQRVDAPCFHLWHPISEGFDGDWVTYNRALYGRYRAASGDPVRMKALVSR